MGRIVLLRHAEALKNTEHRHGGPGTSLTARGCSQAKQFAQLADRYFPDIERVQYVAKPQCFETASMIALEKGWPLSEIERLSPYNLGLLDGLSDEEARERYPEFARMMDDWRLGLIEICQVQIPGATDIQKFYARGQEVLNQLCCVSTSFIIVGTRSVLVLFWNILEGHHPGQGGCYFERPWDSCEWVEFTNGETGSWKAVRVQRHGGW